MSEANDRPVDGDPWADACAEDLEAEKARRRARYGPPPGSAAEELRKLMDAVGEKLSAFPAPLFGAAAQGAVQQVIRQAKSAVEPVVERNPEIFDHLAAAGGELLAAYRSAVEGHETRWTRETDAARGGKGSGRAADDPADPRDEGPSGTERIDLD
ncbi:DUF5304 domain-containing protein [uncultured Streptomyces sp.]|uniref:DUF5304 domain-containing protein n=1 Tax=uncultured Streptomyces sp. TaxID=174707 RepID=UPI002621DF4D|nr:DUF5304 domain-containing protein [uncultured Streptomyces sp.]